MKTGKLMGHGGWAGGPCKKSSNSLSLGGGITGLSDIMALVIMRLLIRLGWEMSSVMGNGVVVAHCDGSWVRLEYREGQRLLTTSEGAGLGGQQGGCSSTTFP